MSIQGIKKELKEIDEILNSNKIQRNEVEEEMKDLEALLVERGTVLSSLNKQWNDYCVKERQQKKFLADLEEQEENAKSRDELNKIYNEKVQDFWVAMQKPLDDWLDHNAKRILWFKTVNQETVIKNCKAAIARHKDPSSISPDLLGCELLEAQAQYKRLNEKIIKLERDKPQDYQRELNMHKFRLSGIWNELFKQRVFKQQAMINSQKS